MLIKLNNNVIIRQISKIHIKLQKIEKEAQNQSKYYVFLLTTCISLFISSHLQNQMWQFTKKIVWHLIIFLWEESQVQHHLRLLLTHRKSKKEREKTHLWKQTFSIILVTTFFFFWEIFLLQPKRRFERKAAPHLAPQSHPLDLYQLEQFSFFLVPLFDCICYIYLIFELIKKR